MSCSLTATYKYVYNNGEIVKNAKGTCVLGSDTGIGARMQETTMYQMLVSAFGGTGFELDTANNYTQENLIIDDSAVSVSGLDIVVDGIIVAEYIGNYKTYPKYTTIQITNVAPGENAQEIGNEIAIVIGRSVSTRWLHATPPISVKNDFAIRSVNLYAHL
jgi:hypothetical protein